MKQNPTNIPQIIEHFELAEPLTGEERIAARRARWRVLKNVLIGARHGLLVRQGVTAARALRSMGFHTGLKGGMRAVQSLYAASFLLIAGAGWITWDMFRPFPGSLERPALMAWSAGPVNVNGAPATPGQALVKGDRVAAVSPAVMLLEGGSLVAIAQQTEFSADTLADRASLSLAAGKILIRFRTGEGRGLAIRTPNATVTVQGTVFSVAYVGGATRVAVLEGEVVILHGETRLLLHAGEAAAAGAGVARMSATEPELDELRRVAALPDIDPIRIYGAAEAAMAEKAMAQPLERERLTIDELREKYGRVDRVTLYSGKVIIGAIVSRGDRYTIETVAGTVRVKAKDVRQTSIQE